MSRVSQAQARENRERVVETASRLFKEQGTQVSVADLMKAAGLTHGAFYKQFASKDALIDEATVHAFATLTRRYAADLARFPGEREAAQEAFVEAYLSAEHRDDPAGGCPAAALASDMARDPGSEEAHRAYTEGIRAYADWLDTGDQGGLARLCTMLGALILARATRDDALSREILDAARAALTVSPPRP